MADKIPLIISGSEVKDMSIGFRLRLDLYCPTEGDCRLLEAAIANLINEITEQADSGE